MDEDYHTAWVNTELQKRTGIDPVFIQKRPVPERSLYGLDSQQRFNGLLREEAYSKISALIPPYSEEKMMVAGNYFHVPKFRYRKIWQNQYAAK